MSDHHTNKDEEEQDVDDNHLSTNVPAHRLCSPYPFGRYHCSHRYISGSVLDIPESGTLNFIEPCHEFKAFIHTPDEKKLAKFIIETIPFSAGCMNSRTNGTIHFGIGDKPHGQVFGVAVEDKEVYGNQLKQAIDRYFEKPQDAHICIKVPRFVEVLHNNDTSSNKYVIEVDIVPDSATCQEHPYFTAQASESNVKSIHKIYSFYVRDGSSTRNMNTDTNKSPKDLNGKKTSEATHKHLVAKVTQNSQRRKRQEEMHLSAFKSSNQGLRLSQFITGGRLSLDESDLKYVVVTNKSHPSQFESLRFLAELKPIAILDFDPESAEQGLEHYCQAQMTVNLHLSRQYISEGIADQLKSTQKTNWIFCNGGISNETPSDIQQWSKEKGASVQHLISILCQKDVSQNKRLRIVFLLLSAVSEAIDPLLYAFRAFRQELGGTSQILCMCDNENAFISWRDLVKAQCEIDISDRCIHQLSFAEVSGTVLSLSSGNCKTERFLPCGGGSKVLLEKSVELCTLEVLCENQCEGANENKMALEKNFYRGGKVSWQNFYYLEKHESSVLIKREHLPVITDSILNVRSHTKPCVLFNLKHEPGCGGTTLARHVLWGNRKYFRCAVLKDRNADSSDVADHVVQLLTYGHEKQLSVPVLLMLDDFDDMNKVSDLQQHIQSKCKKNIKTTQVIILNCFRSCLSELSDINEQTFFIRNKLSAKEQTLFEKTLPKVKQRPRNAETFYTFMIMKKDLMPEYFQAVVRNTLRNFSIAQQLSKLFAALTHLTVKSQNSSLPVSVCEEFLGPDLIHIHGTDRLQGLWGIFANFIWPVPDKNDGPVNVKMIHSLIAKYCLEELTTTDKITIAEMAYVQSELAGLFDSPGGQTFSHWLSKLFR